MSPDLSETLQGISIGEPSEERSRDDADDEDLEERERFVVFELGERRLAVSVDDVGTTTAVPSSITRVPRSPDAIEGVTDLRGDVTAVVDPRAYFPTHEPPTADQDLLVFDRPSDRQSAGIRVDDVRGVESVPTSNVLRDGEFDEGDLLEYGLDAESLVDRTAHPLVAGIVLTSERDEPTETETEADGLLEGDDESPGTTFELEIEDEDDEEREDESTNVVYEATMLIDVERMLLAAGHEQE